MTISAIPMIGASSAYIACMAAVNVYCQGYLIAGSVNGL
jgi:hypothetical protein